MASSPTVSSALWRDRRGQLSYLRVVTLAILVWPLVLVGIDWARDALGGRVLNELIHRSGWWALAFLLVSLAITPLRRSARYGKLVDVRRMIGVASFCYAATHLSLYVVDQGYDIVKVATEIVSRLYLTIGFVALLGLVALAVTSNDAMVKRLGGVNWRRLHQVAYLIGVLALVHYFQQTKADVSVPTIYAGLFAWLIGYRLVARWRGEASLTAWPLVGLTLVASALTFVGEAIGISLSFGISPLMVLATVFDFDLGIRPGWYVLGAGLAVALLDAVRAYTAGRSKPARPLASGKVAAAR